MTDSPVDEMLEQLRASLHARRADVLERVRRIEQALAAYRTSAEERLAFDFAVQHDLKRPKLGPLTPRQAAEQLHSLVFQLPELRELVKRESQRPPSEDVRPSTPRRVSPPSAPPRLPMLDALSRDKKLVIVGALSGRRRALPDGLEQRTEWVDTERDGVHAIGNLPQRIRQQRVAAVVILDRAVQHKHTDPVVAAARDSRTPVAFAGKGGQGALDRALEELESRLSADEG